MQNNADGLLVARICHDLKNCLSVIAFFKEDLMENSVDLKNGLEEFIKSVDNLSLRLSFFQNLAVDGAHIGNLYEMLQQMCAEHGINLAFDINSVDLEQDSIVQNVICGILYLIIVDLLRNKSPHEIITVTDKQLENIVITISNMSTEALPREVWDITEIEEVQATIVNALALYVKKIMKRHGYVTNIFDEQDTTGASNVKIIIKKLF